MKSAPRPILLVGSHPQLEEALAKARVPFRVADDPASAAETIPQAGAVLRLVDVPRYLTPREQQVAVLEALGLNEKAVAQALSIAPGTVKSLRRRASSKLAGAREG